MHGCATLAQRDGVVRQRPIAFVVYGEQNGGLAEGTGIVQHDGRLCGSEQDRLNDAPRRGNVEGVEGQIHSSDRLPRLHQQHRRQKDASARLGNR